MPNSVEYYVSKGFDQRTAEYFAGGRRHIISVTPNADYTLTIQFDNGERRLYDMRPIIQPNTAFEPLLDRNTFLRAFVDDASTIVWDIDPTIDSRIVWNNRIDLDPDTCYIDSTPL